MASPPLLTLILLILLPTFQVHSQPLLNQASPTLRQILHESGQYSKLISLLCSTEVGCHIEKQLNSSRGITLFAPTDNAFFDLHRSQVYRVSGEQLVPLIMYHFIPKYLTMDIIHTLDQPVHTFATDYHLGRHYNLNFDPLGEEVLVSTGIVEAQLSILYQEFPLVIYQVDKVLLPSEMFERQPPPAVSFAPSSLPGDYWFGLASPALSPSEEGKEYLSGDLPLMASPALSPSGGFETASTEPVEEYWPMPTSFCSCEGYEVVDSDFTNHIEGDLTSNVEGHDQVEDNMLRLDGNLILEAPKFLYNYIRKRLMMA